MTNRSGMENLTDLRTETFVIPGTPRPQGSKKHVGNGRFAESSPYTMPHRKIVAYSCKGRISLIEKPMPVSVRCQFQFEQGKTSRLVHHVKPPDIDKLLRLVLDGITGILIEDDSQVTRIAASKQWVHSASQTILTLEWPHDLIASSSS